MTAIQFGPFIIPVLYLTMAISTSFSYGALFFILKDNKERYSTISNLYLNSVMITVLTWKFSPAILNPLSIINDPITIFYQYGTKNHLFIGAMLSIVYIFLSSRKQGVNLFVSS
jgi:formate-dependent nitrite reductase membrane component NrfD